MIEFFRFSPSRLALSYVSLSVLVLALFAVPLWYAWSINLSTFKEYVRAEDVRRMVDIFEREGATGLAAAIESRTARASGDEIVVLADPLMSRIAGNLPAWPTEVPQASGTYGLVIGGPASSMRVVASHVALPGGYHLLVGRESARFQSLVDYFWYGIAIAVAIVLVLGAAIGWLVRRALLAEVQEMSRAAAAIVRGDRSSPLTTRRSSDALATLARTVNGMLEQLARQNVQLEAEITTRARAEQALQRTHEDLERLVAQRTEQLQKTNKSLRRSEASLAEAQQLARVGSFGIKIESRELVCSDETMRITAFEPGTKPTLEDALNRVHPEDRPRIQAVIEQGLRDRSLLEYEHRLLLPDGSVRHVHVVAHTVQDESGTAEFVGAVADITERKSAEDALRLSEQRYALAMEATGDGHWDWNIPVDKMYVSPLLLEMCGLPTDSTFANRSEWVEQFPFYPGERPRYTQVVADHFAGRTDRVDIEIRIVPRGETRWIHMTGRCSRDASGKPTRWAGSVTDITARKRIDEELRARRDMLDLAQKAARAVAFEWRVGAEGENRWSPDLEVMYGIAPGSYDGTYESWKKLVHADDWPGVRAAIKAAQASGDVAAEYRVVHSGGAIRWLQAKGRMFFDREKNPTRVVGFMLDVTDRHVAESELQRMERQLRQGQRLEAMGTLAGGIAHDFNNLLGAILGYGEMALRDAPPGSRLRRDVENMMIAGERGRALVDRILAFSRSGVGERVAVHVEDVVRETLALFAAKLPRGIAIEERLNAGLAAVMGDATQIHQVLMNLCTNAVQAMPSGGHLRVSLQRARIDAPRVAVTGTIAPRDYVVLEVADTGGGIPRETLERIFDPFFTTKEVGVGTGLGLSLVHGIVTGLDGVIDVATVVGKGSVFTVYLPRTGNVNRERKLARSVEARVQRGGHERILVVDDEAPLVKLVTETLDGLGYAPVGFTSSAMALAAFLADPHGFDAVITDESMPGMSGSELIRGMRGARPTMPILLVSGYLSPPVVQRARDTGATEVLKKPLSADQLATALDRVLHAASAPHADEVIPVPSGKRAARQARSPRTQASTAPSKRR